MDVSENSGTPKSSILIGFSIINHPFWDTPILETPIYPSKSPKAPKNGFTCPAQPSRIVDGAVPFPRASTESALRKSMAMVECLGIPKMLMFFLKPQGSTNHPLNHPNYSGNLADLRVKDLTPTTGSMKIYPNYTRWWFQRLSIFTPEPRGNDEI